MVSGPRPVISPGVKISSMVSGFVGVIGCVSECCANKLPIRERRKARLMTHGFRVFTRDLTENEKMKCRRFNRRRTKECTPENSRVHYAPNSDCERRAAEIRRLPGSGRLESPCQENSADPRAKINQLNAPRYRKPAEVASCR